MLASEKDRKGTLLEMQLVVELRTTFSTACSSLGLSNESGQVDPFNKRVNFV